MVFGTNLASSVGYGRFTTKVSNMIVLPTKLFSVVVGLLLSDGTIQHASIWIIWIEKKLIQLKAERAHDTPEGRKLMEEIKASMNKGR